MCPNKSLPRMAMKGLRTTKSFKKSVSQKVRCTITLKTKKTCSSHVFWMRLHMQQEVLVLVSLHSPLGMTRKHIGIQLR